MSEKVTFQELIESIADQTNNSKQFTHDFLKDFVAVINNGLESDGTISIAGFGKFKLRAMDERDGYNPQTGEKITIPAHNKVVFKPYKDVRELVNAPYRHLEAELLDDETKEDSADAGKEKGQEPAPLSSESQKPEQETTEEGPDKAPWEQSMKDTKDSDLDSKTPSNKKSEEKELTDLQSDDQEESFNDGDIVEYSPSARTVNRNYKTVGPSSGYTRRYDPDELRRMASSSPSGKKIGRRNRQSQSRIWIAAACIILLLTAGVWYFVSSTDSYDLMTINLASLAGDDEQQEEPVSLTEQINPPVTTSSSGQQKQNAEPVNKPDNNQQSHQQSASNKRVIVKGQTLWSLAEQQYDNPYLWPWIYDENKSSISNPDLIMAGQTLALPLPGGPTGGLSTGDSLQVAIGYIETYRWYKNHGYKKAKFYLYAARIYKDNVFDYIDVNIDDADLAFANRAR